MIGLPRSTYYYRAQEGSLALTDSELEELIGTVQDELPGYGYRRVTHELRRRGLMPMPFPRITRATRLWFTMWPRRLSSCVTLR